MVIGAVQMDIVWGDVLTNRVRTEEFICDKLSNADVVILPEMFSTGFSMKPERVAEDIDSSPTLAWMREMAVKYGKAIIASIPIKDNNRYYNRLFFVKDSGDYEFYDKRHLFRMSGEDKVYCSGERRVIIEYKGVRFMPLVCYDLRFPVWSRMQSTEYDVIIYIASWPDARVYAWDTLLRARAIENLCYVVGVNRVGDDKANHYNGHSAVIDYMGREIATAIEDRECAITAEIDLGKLRNFREKFPTYMDSDKFSIDSFE